MTTFGNLRQSDRSEAPVFFEGPIDLGEGIFVSELKKEDIQKRKRLKGGSLFHIHVTSMNSGSPKAELDLSSIERIAGRIPLEDLENFSKELQRIVRILRLQQGDYSFSSGYNKVETIAKKLQEIHLDSETVSQKSREEIVAEEIEESFSAEEVAKKLSISRQAVQKKRQSYTILGLKVANRYVYPKWQFDTYGQIIPGICDVLRHLFSAENNPREIVARLNDRRPFLEGCSIKQCLIDGRTEDAIMAAENLSGLRA